jgi:hypothetical protein
MTISRRNSGASAAGADPRIDRIRATRRFGAFAVLTLRASDKITRGEWIVPEAAAHFEQMARTHGLRETAHYDPKLVDMLIARVRQSRNEERRMWGEGD